MLTNDQNKFFRTFGFLCLRQLFSGREMDLFAHEAEAFWEHELKCRPDGLKVVHGCQFIEKRCRMRELPADDRLYMPLQRLLGDDFIWSGSECNSGVQSGA